jgi:hypothetical protein
VATFRDVCDRLSAWNSRPSKEDYVGKRRLLDVSGLLALSAMATLIAALVGTITTIIITAPLSFLALIIFPIILRYLVLAAVLAAPVTFGLFPLTYRLVRGRPILAQLLIPAVGFVGDCAIISAWIAAGVLPHSPDSHQLFSAIGMISGLSAGAFYVRGLYA